MLQLLFKTPLEDKVPFLSWIHVLCASCVLLNVATQVLVAVIGLAYSLDVSSIVIAPPGQVSINDISAVTSLDQPRRCTGT
jgi:hypothetical protein